MSLSITKEQEELKRSIREFFAARYSVERLREIFEKNDWDSSEEWDELDALGMHVYFASGAELGANFRDLSIISHEVGYSLAPLPLAEELLFGAYLLAIELGESDRSACRTLFGEKRFDAILAGKERIVLLREAKAGTANFVASREVSNAVVLSADRTRGSVVNFKDTAKCKVEDSLDRLIKRSTVSYSPPANSHALTPEQVQRLIRLDEILRASEISGACERVIEMTKDYVTTRKQYGSPVGAFQAVQHRLVDMYVQAQALQALVDFAAWCADHDPAELQLAALAAISYATKTGPEIVEGAIQLHGGIGFTWEYPLHLYLRRVKTIEALYGGVENRAEEILELVNKD